MEVAKQPAPQTAAPSQAPAQAAADRYADMRLKNTGNIDRMRGEMANVTDPKQRTILERNIRRLEGINRTDLNPDRVVQGPMLNGVAFNPAARKTAVAEFIDKQAGPLSAVMGLGSKLKNMGSAAVGAAKALPGVAPAGKFISRTAQNPYFQRYGVRPAMNTFTGLTAGSLADYGAHEMGINDTNFTTMGGLAGLGHGLGRAGLRDALGAKTMRNIGKTVVPFTKGTTLKQIGQGVGRVTGGKIGTGAELASIPLTSFVSTDQEGKYGFNPFSLRDRATRIGTNAAMAKGDEMARGFGFNSMGELQKHPIGQGLKGWNTGGIGGAISGALGAMTPQEKARLFAGLAGGAGMLGGAGLAAAGHPLLGAGLGAAGAGGLGYGLLSKSPTPSSLINSMSPEQRQGMFNNVPDYAWETMSRPQQISTLQGGMDGGLSSRNEFAGAQGGGLK